MKTIHRFLSIVSLGLAGLASSSRAQVVVTTGYSATDLVNHLNGTGVVVFGATLTCPYVANGEFTASGTSLGFGSGIVLTNGTAMTTGTAVGIDGPASQFASTSLGTPGDADLTTLAGGPTHDACVLQFSFIPSGDTISFDYVFGSEEYTDYACSSFNDVFGFFVTGGAYTTPYNMARVPGTNIPVCINSINCGATGGNPISTCNALGAGAPFCDYYVDNSTGTYISYDGLTTTLTAKAGVNPLDTYTLKIGVADVTDEVLDSGVLLATGSLRSAPPTKTKMVLAEGAIAIFPNPVKDDLEVSGAKGTDASIADMTGKVVLVPGAITTASQHLDLSGLAKGTYMLSLTNSDTKTTTTRCFVKQ